MVNDGVLCKVACDMYVLSVGYGLCLYTQLCGLNLIVLLILKYLQAYVQLVVVFIRLF